MAKSMKWLELYSVIVEHCDSMDDALDKVRDYADVLLFPDAERNSLIRTVENRKEFSHLTIMSEVYRIMSSRYPAEASAEEVGAIVASLILHNCVEDEDNVRLLKRATGWQDANASAGRMFPKSAPPPLFSHQNVVVLCADDQPSASIVTGSVDNNAQYRFGTQRNASTKRFGATKPSSHINQGKK
jgi:hypothetical protein